MAKKNSDNDILTVAQASKRLGLSQGAVNMWARRGRQGKKLKLLKSKPKLVSWKTLQLYVKATGGVQVRRRPA